MTKYMLTISTLREADYHSVSTTSNDIDFVSFSADVGNPSYDQFLVSAELTDEELHGLTPDVWYDFPVKSEVVEEPVVEEPPAKDPIPETPAA